MSIAARVGAEAGKTLLFIGASPEGAPRILVENELKVIRRKIDGSRRNVIQQVVPFLGAEPPELLEGLQRYGPTALHLAGHGLPQALGGGLLLQNPDGTLVRVSRKSIKDTIVAAGSSLRVVSFSACY